MECSQSPVAAPDAERLPYTGGPRHLTSTEHCSRCNQSAWLLQGSLLAQRSCHIAALAALQDIAGQCVELAHQHGLRMVAEAATAEILAVS